MRILNTGELKSMSAIIGVCGTNFCSFIADGRMVRNSKDGVTPVSDNIQKIFKINDRVLFGATGWFEQHEEITSPLDVYPNKSVITLRMAYKAVLEYIEQHKYAMPQTRNYLVGGKDNKGQFCIYEVHVNFETFKAETALRAPVPPEYNFAISCALPPKLASRVDEFTSMVGSCIRSCSYHQDMLQKVAGVIRKISEMDDTVGTNIMTLSVS